MGAESGREAAPAAASPAPRTRDVLMPVITAVVVAALSMVASVLDSRISDLRADVEQIKRDVGGLREDVAYIKGRIDEALKRSD